jgi:hypothetical protein
MLCMVVNVMLRVQVIGALCFTMRKNGVRFLLGEQLAKVEVVSST